MLKYLIVLLKTLVTKSYLNATSVKLVFNETAPYEQGFTEHYKQYIRPLVSEYEQKRIATLNQCRRNLMASLVLAPFGIVFFFVFNVSLALSIFLIFFILAPLFIIYTIIYCFIALFRRKPNKKTKEGYTIINWYNPFALFIIGFFAFIVSAMPLIFPFLIFFSLLIPIFIYKNNVKKEIFPKIISFFGGYSYQPVVKNRVKSLKRSDIIPNYNVEQSEDQIQGAYKGVAIDIFDTQLKYKGNNDSAAKTVFNGVLISLAMNKAFSGKTIIKKDFGRVGNFLKSKPVGLENVRLEDPLFEKQFEVYSNDQIEARYLLTPAYMERLLKLSNKFGGKGLQCSFYEGGLLIMIPTSKNMFEPGPIIEKEDFVDDCKSLLFEINEIHEIINILKLYQNIGM